MAVPNSANPAPPHPGAETGADSARSAMTRAADGALSSAAATTPAGGAAASGCGASR